MERYRTVTVRARAPKTYSQQSTSFTAFDVTVDDEHLARDVAQACERLAGEGFLTVSVTPITSAQGRFRDGPDSGHGYGLSYTSAVVITAHRSGD